MWLGLLTGGCDTLLGPEGSGPNQSRQLVPRGWLVVGGWVLVTLGSAGPWWFPYRHTVCVWLVGAVSRGGRSYVENYTVDASIFVALSF